MPALARNLCPVCHRDVKPTLRANIAAHLDSIRADTCPGSGHPFRITVYSEPEFLGVQIGDIKGAA